MSYGMAQDTEPFPVLDDIAGFFLNFWPLCSEATKEVLHNEICPRLEALIPRLEPRLFSQVAIMPQANLQPFTRSSSQLHLSSERPPILLPSSIEPLPSFQVDVVPSPPVSPQTNTEPLSISSLPLQSETPAQLGTVDQVPSQPVSMPTPLQSDATQLRTVDLLPCSVASQTNTEPSSILSSPLQSDAQLSRSKYWPGLPASVAQSLNDKEPAEFFDGDPGPAGKLDFYSALIEVNEGKWLNAIKQRLWSIGTLHLLNSLLEQGTENGTQHRFFATPAEAKREIVNATRRHHPNTSPREIKANLTANLRRGKMYRELTKNLSISAVLSLSPEYAS